MTRPQPRGMTHVGNLRVVHHDSARRFPLPAVIASIDVLNACTVRVLFCSVVHCTIYCQYFQSYQIYVDNAMTKLSANPLVVTVVEAIPASLSHYIFLAAIAIFAEPDVNDTYFTILGLFWSQSPLKGFTRTCAKSPPAHGVKYPFTCGPQACIQKTVKPFQGSVHKARVSGETADVLDCDFASCFADRHVFLSVLTISTKSIGPGLPYLFHRIILSTSGAVRLHVASEKL